MNYEGDICWNCGRGVNWRKGDDDGLVKVSADCVDCCIGSGMEMRSPLDRCDAFSKERLTAKRVTRRVLRQNEVCDILGICPNTFRMWCRDGNLPAVKLGQQWFVVKDKFDMLFGFDGKNGGRR